MTNNGRVVAMAGVAIQVALGSSTAWGAASAFGPLLIHMRQTSGNYRGALHVIAIIVLLSIALPALISPPRRETQMSAVQRKGSEAA
jgi:hypothetical protein